MASRGRKRPKPYKAPLYDGLVAELGWDPLAPAHAAPRNTRKAQQRDGKSPSPIEKKELS